MQNGQTSFDSHETGNSAPKSDEALRIVVAYEDPAAAQRVQRLFDRTALNLKTGGLGTMRCAMWKITGPNLPARMKMAANKAKAADIIVIAAHERATMPEMLQEWIGLWLPKKIVEPCGLIALLDHSTENDAHCGIHRYLKYVAHFAKLAFFANGGDEDLDDALRTKTAGPTQDEPLIDSQNIACQKAPHPNNRLDWNFYRRSA